MFQVFLLERLTLHSLKQQENGMFQTIYKQNWPNAGEDIE